MSLNDFYSEISILIQICDTLDRKVVYSTNFSLLIFYILNKLSCFIMMIMGNFSLHLVSKILSFMNEIDCHVIML